MAPRSFAGLAARLRRSFSAMWGVGAASCARTSSRTARRSSTARRSGKPLSVYEEGAGMSVCRADVMALEAAPELEKLRQVVQDCLSKHLHSSAVFFADKLVCLSESAAADVYLLAEAYYLSKQYKRALQLLRHEELLSASPHFRYLGAKCYAECAEWDKCLTLLGEVADDTAELGAGGAAIQGWREATGGEEQDSLEAAGALLRGRAYDALENRAKAATWYRRALLADPFCYEALESLLDHHMLTHEEEKQLLESLELPPEFAWVHTLYAAKAKKYEAAASVQDRLQALAAGSGGAPGGPAARDAEGQARGGAAGAGAEDRMVAVVQRLRTNADVIACQAEWHYQRGEYAACYEAGALVLASDAYHLATLPCYLAAALELRRKNELFLRAHKLMDAYPHRAVAWFAVGCYYFCTKAYDNARRYFSRATQLESSFAPAWMGFGHAFAAQDESDQAMAAYRTASRLFPGSHLPVLCIGMEYQRTNNLPLAAQFFQQARALCPSDPLVYNELGVLAYRNKEWATAERCLRHALTLVPPPLPESWEATVVNLAHCLRKQQKYDAAVDQYEHALSLNPRGASTHAALGYTYHLQAPKTHARQAHSQRPPQGKLELAIEYYHKALGLKPDDSFTHEMLDAALLEQCSAAFPKW